VAEELRRQFRLAAAQAGAMFGAMFGRVLPAYMLDMPSDAAVPAQEAGIDAAADAPVVTAPAAPAP
jgi:hypothetical protein